MKPELASVFITEQLTQRGQVRSRLLEEKFPMRDLARAMIDDPKQVLPVLVDRAMEACGAVSAGISLYEPDPAPGVFRWHNLRGELERFTGATTPRHYSPCGVTLDQRKPILVQRPERVYTWLQEASVSLPECLLVPLYMGAEQLLGTLWLVSRDEGHFDSNHAEIANEMASFAGVALRSAMDKDKLNEALKQRELLSREMSHRLKNVLTVVRGLLRISVQAVGSAHELASVLDSKLIALSAAYDLVHASPDAPVVEAGMGDLLTTILGPYSVHNNRLDGPKVRLSPEAANVLALVLHELATNAAKYGSFSLVAGFVQVTWGLRNGRLHLEWSESGGPAIVSKPKSTGFGSLLASRSVRAIGGTISFNWQATGLVVSIELPVAQLSTPSDLNIAKPCRSRKAQLVKSRSGTPQAVP